MGPTAVSSAQCKRTEAPAKQHWTGVSFSGSVHFFLKPLGALSTCGLSVHIF